MTTLHHLSGSIVAVEGLPEDAYNFHIHPNSDGLWYKLNTPKGDLFKRIDLKGLKYQILGWSDELSEMQCVDLVDEPYTTGIEQYTKPDDLTNWTTSKSPMGIKYCKVIYCGYKDYSKDCDDYSTREQYPFKTATESLSSLLRSVGCEAERVLILKNID